MILSAPAVVGHHKRRLGMHWGGRSMCFHTSVSQIHTFFEKHENAEKWMLGWHSTINPWCSVFVCTLDITYDMYAHDKTMKDHLFTACMVIGRFGPPFARNEGAFARGKFRLKVPPLEANFPVNFWVSRPQIPADF